MDFIEKLFGVAPDGGSGTLELAIFLALILGVACAAWAGKAYRSRKSKYD